MQLDAACCAAISLGAQAQTKSLLNIIHTFRKLSLKEDASGTYAFTY